MIGPMALLSLKILLVELPIFLEFLFFLVLVFLVPFDCFCLVFTSELFIVINKIIEINKSVMFYLLIKI